MSMRMSTRSQWSVALALLILGAWLASCSSSGRDEWAATSPGATSTPMAVAGAHADDDDDADDDGDDGEEGEEQAIALDKVPADILAAARAALPGAVFTSAEVETEDGLLVYCLEGQLDGEAVEVEVAADGRVLEIERGED